jgi:hypothetical protein
VCERERDRDRDRERVMKGLIFQIKDFGMELGENWYFCYGC